MFMSNRFFKELIWKGVNNIDQEKLFGNTSQLTVLEYLLKKDER